MKEGRIKPRTVRPPNAMERRHFERIAGRGCVVCGADSTIHHVTASSEGGRITRSHQRIVGLCPFHHFIQWNPKTSIEALGHKGFREHYGIDLLGVAEDLWAQSLRKEGIQ